MTAGFALMLVTGAALLALGATRGLDLLGALLFLFGITYVAWSTRGIYRRVKTIGRLALGGVVGGILLIVGLMIGVRTYDAEYFGDPYPGWEVLDGVGAGMFAFGLLLLAVSIFGMPAVAVARAVRRTNVSSAGR